jgi:hypothetical protein
MNKQHRHHPNFYSHRGVCKFIEPARSQGFRFGDGAILDTRDEADQPEMCGPEIRPEICKIIVISTSTGNADNPT